MTEMPHGWRLPLVILVSVAIGLGLGYLDIQLRGKPAPQATVAQQPAAPAQLQPTYSIAIESGEFGQNVNEVRKGWARIRGSTNLPNGTRLSVSVERKGVFTDMDPNLDPAAERTWTGVRNMGSMEGQEAFVLDGHFDTGVFAIMEPKPMPPDILQSKFLPTVWVLVGETRGYGPGGKDQYLTTSREFSFPVMAQTTQ
jgi:hypothetical protein